MKHQSYTAYSEARSIARKRLERLTASGYVNADVRFPTVKELKAQGIKPEKALKAVTKFLESDIRVATIKKNPEQTVVFKKTDIGVTTSKLNKLKRQDVQQSYRERVRNLTQDQKALIKTARTLGLNIGPATVKPFEEYVKYRQAQGIGSVKYFMANIVEDYMEVTKGRRKHPEEVIADYERFLTDRSELISSWQAIIKGEEPTTQTADEFHVSWLEYIKFRNKKRK